MATRVFVCPHCEQQALGEVCAQAVWNGTSPRTGEFLDIPLEYSLVQCQECGNISLELRGNSGEGFAADSPSILYPAQRSLSTEIPNSLRREFEEAQACFDAKAYKAAVVMVRSVLEGACQDNGVEAWPLVKGLERMRESGLIDGTISEWAHALRILGNEGAHFTGKQVSRNDAEDSLAFAEALLDHIYVLRKRFEEFAKRREDTAKSKETT